MEFVRAGAVFVDRDRRLTGKAHAWVVLTQPDADDKVLLVMLCTMRPHTDNTTIILPGEHLFAEVETVVSYRETLLVSRQKLSGWFGSGRAVPLADASGKLLQRILNGLLVSGHTPNWVADYLSLGGDE